MGYNRGFMKKHILMPMFEKSKLNAKEWYQTQGDARIAQIKIERIDKLILELDSDNPAAILEEIENVYAAKEGGGNFNYKLARQEVVGLLKEAAEAGKLKPEHMEILAKLEFKGHDFETTGKLKVFSEYWETEYNALNTIVAGKEYEAALAKEQQDAAKQLNFKHEAI